MVSGYIFVKFFGRGVLVYSVMRYCRKVVVGEGLVEEYFEYRDYGKIRFYRFGIVSVCYVVWI